MLGTSRHGIEVVFANDMTAISHYATRESCLAALQEMEKLRKKDAGGVIKRLTAIIHGQKRHGSAAQIMAADRAKAGET